MIERLVESLEMLAAPAGVQLARAPDFAARSGELALDFADALRLVTDCPQLLLTSAQRDALEQLDAYLERLAGSTGGEFRTERAVRTSAEWSQVRRLAVGALMALGVTRHA